MDLQMTDCHVDNKLFEQELRKYYDTGEFSEELGTIILKLIAGQLYSYKWIKYSGAWRDALYGAAMENCIETVTKKLFDFEKYSNVFGYFYKVVTNAFLTALAKLKRQSDKMDEYRELTYTTFFRDNPEHIYVKPDDDFECWEEIVETDD